MSYSGRTYETFIATSASVEDAVVYGTISGAVTVEEISGSTIGSVDNLMRISATDPQAGSVVVVPLLTSGDAFPDAFRFVYSVSNFSPPANSYSTFLSFANATNTLAWNVFFNISTSSLGQNIPIVSETLSQSIVGGQWLFPSQSINSAVNIYGAVRKIAPFSNPPQVEFKLEAGGLSLEPTITSIAYSLNPTTGSVHTQWAGEDFVSASFGVAFDIAEVGTVNTNFSVTFLPY